MILTLVNFFLRESAYVQKLSLSLLYVTSYGMTITSHNKGLLESQGPDQPSYTRGLLSNS